MLKLYHAETATAATQVEAHLQAVKITTVSRKSKMVEQSACHVADKGPQQYSRLFQPKRWS
jgi:hypothetical protein